MINWRKVGMMLSYYGFYVLGYICVKIGFCIGVVWLLLVCVVKCWVKFCNECNFYF